MVTRRAAILLNTLYDAIFALLGRPVYNELHISKRSSDNRVNNLFSSSELGYDICVILHDPLSNMR